MTPFSVAETSYRPLPAAEDRWTHQRRYYELLRMLASRTLKTRYRGSILGVFWSLANPVLMTGIYSLIFGTTFSSYYGNSIANYVFATMIGLFVLNFFSQTSAQALTSVVSNGGLLNKVKLPVSLFPMAFVASNAFQFCVGPLLLLAAITLYKSHSIVNVAALTVPLLGLLLTTIGFALVVSALYVYFRDLPYMYDIVLFMVWMTSPIFYPASIVPERVRPYLEANPLSFTVESIRQLALAPNTPDLRLMGSSLLLGVVVAAIGAAIFFARKNDFMDLL